MRSVRPAAAIAPNADLVAWSRLGSSYRPEHLKQALETDRTLFELDALVRPMSDLGLHVASAADRPHYERTREWLKANKPVAKAVQAELDDLASWLGVARR